MVVRDSMMQIAGEVLTVVLFTEEAVLMDVLTVHTLQQQLFINMLMQDSLLLFTNQICSEYFRDCLKSARVNIVLNILILIFSYQLNIQLI